MYWITELDGKSCPAVGVYDSRREAQEAAVLAVKQSPYPIFLAVVPELTEVWQVTSDDHPDADYAHQVVSWEGLTNLT